MSRSKALLLAFWCSMGTYQATRGAWGWVALDVAFALYNLAPMATRSGRSTDG